MTSGTSVDALIGLWVVSGGSPPIEKSRFFVIFLVSFAFCVFTFASSWTWYSGCQFI